MTRHGAQISPGDPWGGRHRAAAFYLAGWWGEPAPSGNAEEKGPAPREPGEVRLVNGAVVELLAIRRSGQPEQAWDIDGVTTQWPRDLSAGAVDTVATEATSEDAAVYEVAVQIRGVSEPEAVTWFGTAEPDGDVEGEIRFAWVKISAEAESVRLRVGTPRSTWMPHDLYGFVPEPEEDEDEGGGGGGDRG